jgi:enamine deaminase RidA (YjgF/YER057c/UK114 family)
MRQPGRLTGLDRIDERIIMQFSLIRRLIVIFKRIRPFNTKQIYPENKRDNDLSQAVVARGTMVFLRGQVSQELGARECLHAGDARAQTCKIMENIKMLLEEAGSEMNHICRVVTYLTDIRYREAVYQEMGQWLKGVFPCSTGLVVSALARPEWVVEIEVTAVIPDATTP